MEVIQKLFKQVTSIRHQNNVTLQHSMVEKTNKRKSYNFLPDELKAYISTTEKKNEKFASIPYQAYIPKLTEEITKLVRYFVPEVKNAHRPPQKIAQFYSKLKEKVDKLDLTGVVYDIPCKGGETRYIGTEA